MQEQQKKKNTEGTLDFMEPEMEAVEEVTPAETTFAKGSISQADIDSLNDTSAFKSSSSKFRNQLTKEERSAVERAAPELAEKMIANPSYIIEFGNDVLEGVRAATSQLMKEQAHIDLPDDIGVIATNILRALDGVELKYSVKDDNSFIRKIKNKFKKVQYDVKSAVRDAKSLEEKLDMSAEQLGNMIEELKDNVIRGKVLRDQLMESLADVIRVLAIFEEIIDYIGAELVEIEDVLKGASDDDTVVWKGNQILAFTLKNIQREYSEVFRNAEKTWFSWRERLFLYNANIVAIQNIINSSIQNQHTIARVRNETIDQAKLQLVNWQQARQGAKSADAAKTANDVANTIITRASQGTTEAVRKSAEAANMSLLDEKTILTITNDIRTQFDDIVRAEREGRASRLKNLEIIQNSEKVIAQAESEARTKLVQDAMEVVRADNIGTSEEVTSTIEGVGFTNSKLNLS